MHHSISFLVAIVLPTVIFEAAFVVNPPNLDTRNVHIIDVSLYNIHNLLHVHLVYVPKALYI